MLPNADQQRSLQVAINELNNLLQVADESVRSLESLCGGRPDATKQLNFLRFSLERAGSVANQLIDLVEGREASSSAHSSAHPSTPPPDMLPVPPVETPADADPAAGIEIANPSGTRELIMLIDDEPLVNSLATKMLTDEGYRVVASTCPFKAIEIFKKLHDQIGLVILDFTIPILNGEDVFQELQKIQPSVGVLLSSGYTEQSIVGRMLGRGLRGFLPKPYTPDRLLKQVRVTLDGIKR